MRHIVLLATMAFLAGMFVLAQGVFAGEKGVDKSAECNLNMEGMGHMEQMGNMEGTRAMATHQFDSKQIVQLQKILNEKGYDAGIADGKLGYQTEHAIRTFQQDQGLAVTGTPDNATLKALAPDVATQEFFGLAPKTGEKMMEHAPVKMDQMAPKGSMEKSGY